MLPSACLPPCLSPGRGAGPPTVSRHEMSTVPACACVLFVRECTCVRLCVQGALIGASDLHAAGLHCASDLHLICIARILSLKEESRGCVHVCAARRYFFNI